MELREVPVVGEPLVRTARVAETGLRAGRWAVQETRAAVGDRVLEMQLHYSDELVTSNFRRCLAEEQSVASLEGADVFSSERIQRDARSCIQMFAEHYARFKGRNNHQKTTDYATRIHDFKFYAGDDFTLEDLGLDPVVRESLRADLELVAKVAARVQG